MKGLSRAAFEDIRQAMLLGAARRSLTPPPAVAALIATAPAAADASLYLLALTAQHRRFERAPVPDHYEVPHAARCLHADPRPILPAAARRACLRLLGVIGKDLAGVVMPVALRRIAAAGFRPHPFDLPRLVSFLGADDGSLGLSERAFLMLSEKPTQDGPVDLLSAELDDATWLEAPKAQRRQFLRARRAADPAAGRTLLAKALPSEPAASRADLLGTLSVKLGPDDVEFIEGFLKDRSSGVREAAVALLARVRGTPDHAKRLDAAAKSFQRSSGVHNVLSFVPPPSFDAREQLARAQRLFDGLSLPDVAVAVGCSAQAILDTLPEDDVVFWTFHATAILEADAATLQMLSEHQLMGTRAFPSLLTLVRLTESCPAPLPEERAVTLLSTGRWSDAVRRAVGGDVRSEGVLVLFATMLPVGSMTAFLATIAPVNAGAARPARAFAELLGTLHNAEPGALEVPFNSP